MVRKHSFWRLLQRAHIRICSEHVTSHMGWFLVILVPVLGTFTAWFLLGNQLPYIYRAHSSQSLGSMNVVPLALTLANSTAWALYGALAPFPTNVYAFVANFPGILFSILYVSVAMRLGSVSQSRQVLGILLLFTLIFVPMAYFCAQFLDIEDARAVVGIATNLVLVLYYGSPLSSMWTVIKTKSSESIHAPMMVTSAANASLWTAYGVAVNDFYLVVPNGLGVVLSCAQFILWMIFPRKCMTSPPDSVQLDELDQQQLKA